MSKPNSGIYRITSPMGAIYIGQSKNIRNRKSAYRRNDKNGQPKIFNSINKYGFDNHKFELIHELPKDAGQLIFNNYEKLYIDQYNECGFNILNLKGKGIVLGSHSDESKLKMSESRKGKKLKESHKKNIGTSHLGKKRKEGTGKKISDSLIGRKFSDERKKNIKYGLRNKPPVSESAKLKMSESTKGIKNHFFGKKHSDESKYKMSQKLKGRVRSIESIKKTAEKLKGRKRVFTEEWKRNIGLSQIGIKPSIETKIKMSESGKKRFQLEKNRIAQSIATKLWWDKRKGIV